MYKYVYKVKLQTAVVTPNKRKSAADRILPFKPNSLRNHYEEFLIISDDEIKTTTDNKWLHDECRKVLMHLVRYDFEIDTASIYIEEYMVCNMEYNEYLPERFFLLLKYLKEAIYVYSNDIDYQGNISRILDKFNEYDFNSQRASKYKAFSSCPDAEYISVQASYYNQINVLQYTERVVQEIINTLHIDTIKQYDNIGSIYEIEAKHNSISTPKDRLLNKIQDGMHILFEVLNSFSTPHRTRNINDFKYRFVKDLKASSLEELFLCLKRSIILNYKIESLYRKKINVSLSGEGDDSTERIMDIGRDDIIALIRSNYASHKKVKEMLDIFNSDYHIMIDQKPTKKKLATLILIMYHSKYIIKDIPFSNFKSYVCKYYGYPDSSFKINDVEKDARDIFLSRRLVFENNYRIEKWW